MSISLSNINFSYKNKQALKNINLTIEKGESIALIGSNGSGKSTFLKLLNALIFPQKGIYKFDNIEINSKKMKDSKFLKEFHQKLGFIFQNSETQLFCSSVYDEIAFGPRQMELKISEISLRVEDCLKLLGISNLKNEIPYNLSGGEKKKVAIASVLSMNPDIIIMDEPMNGIDPKGKRFLKQLFFRLNQSGKTLICATHEFQYIDGIFNRAIVFSENNEIVRDGKFDEVVNDKVFLKKHNII